MGKLIGDTSTKLPRGNITSDASPRTHYAIYIHHAASKNNDNLINWEKRATTKTRKEAIKSAQSLMQSYDCQKIEIVKKYTDPKTNRRTEKTIKTLGIHDKEQVQFPVRLALIILFFSLITLAGLFITSGIKAG